MPKFSVCVFPDSCLVFEKIELAASKAREPSWGMGQSAMEMSFDLDNTRFNQQVETLWANQVLVIINVRLGVDIIEPVYA